MRKFFLCAFALFAATFISSAQMDDREPGLYAMIDGESVPLVYHSGIASTTKRTLLGLEVDKSKYEYKGATSGIVASDTFVLVINPEKKNIIKTLRKYDIFVRGITPDNLAVVALEVKNGKKRIYDEGTVVGGIAGQTRERAPMEWEMISDNSYRIKVDLAPGEYAFVCRATKLAPFDFTAIYDFTIYKEAGQD